MEQALFSIPLSKLEPVIKGWLKDVINENLSNTRQKPEIIEKLLTIQEAAKFLSLSVPTIYSKVSKKELPVSKVGKRLYFSTTELTEYIKSGRKLTMSDIKAKADAHSSLVK